MFFGFDSLIGGEVIRKLLNPYSYGLNSMLSNRGVAYTKVEKKDALTFRSRRVAIIMKHIVSSFNKGANSCYTDFSSKLDSIGSKNCRPRARRAQINNS